jgi:lipoprotein-anchoring transpeptidase ErfK/SrfK
MQTCIQFFSHIGKKGPLRLVASCLMAMLLSQCNHSSSGKSKPVAVPGGDRMVVSVKEQKMVLQRAGIVEKVYQVSTSKFGLGDAPRSNRTPVGRMYIHEKVGDGAPMGAVFKGRRRTGEIVPPNCPGRDPIVTRILWLGGLENQNRNCLSRTIYIHGTPEERNIGRPASYGCIRMRSSDVIDLYQRVQAGDRINVITGGFRAGRSS